MKRLISILFLIALCSSCWGQKSNDKLVISFPMTYSGLCAPLCFEYVIENGFLFEIEKLTDYSDVVFDSTIHFNNLVFDSSFEEKFKRDTITTYTLNDSMNRQFQIAIAKIDSLGFHSATGCSFQFGATRFSITVYRGDEVLEGYISNCYRHHIFQFIDLINATVPDERKLKYSKQKLIDKEKKCNENIK